MLGRVDKVCDQFEAVWKEGGRPRIEDYLSTACGAERGALLRELVRVELEYRYGRGESPTPEEYHQRFPGDGELLDSGFASIRKGGADQEQLDSTALDQRQCACQRAGAKRTEPAAADAVRVWAGRFRIEEDISKGTGGMGDVFRVRDDKLNRTLAVKALKEEFRDDPELTARFLLEAEITGQLQHPAIPPIHEVGEMEDGRPFFAMKLIQGSRLADLLDEGHDCNVPDAEEARYKPAPQDLPRWLGVFEHICQAVSYAHSERVIHRDLKPRNVMVGRFGEVQVMDWGLAKKLAAHSSAVSPALQESDEDPLAPRSHPGSAAGGESRNGLTPPGTMLGTAAYMPPEQAKGAWEQADERVDVFALGSILCEILTGKPAYVGGARLQLERKAQRGELADAFARLEGCGADVELVQLARRCLAPDKADRPRDAGVIAEAITSYLAGVQERLRAAELEQAAVQARAEEATKKAAAELRAAQAERDAAQARAEKAAAQASAAQARAEKAAAQAVAMRRARRLMMVLAAAVLGAVGLGTAGGVYRQQQRQRAREQAKVGLEQVAALRDAYRFDDARTMLEQVRGWANQAADRQLHARLLQTESELELARDLDYVRQRAGMFVDGKWDSGRVREEYPVVLTRHGLDVLEGALDELAQMIRASAVRGSIIAVLDDWARQEIDQQRKLRLLKLANSADEPDPWRQAVRQAVMRKDEKAAHQLLGGSRNGKPTPGVVVLLATLFREESEVPTVLLRRMQLDRPGDFWVNFDLGNRLAAQKRYQEAADCFLVALGLRSDSVPTYVNLGSFLMAIGKVDEAIHVYQKAILLNPLATRVHDKLGKALQAKDKLDDAIECFKKARLLNPKDAMVHINLGNALKIKRKMHEAIECYQRAIHLDPNLAEAHAELGRALMEQGEFIEAQKSIRRSLELLPRGQGRLVLTTKWLEQCRQLLYADAKLKAFLDGNGPPADVTIQLQMADLARQPYKCLYLTAARLYRDAFARQPTLARGHRFNAACSAALAGCGQAKDADKLDDKERSTWRTQARDWLRLDLQALSKTLEKANVQSRAAVAQQMQHWQTDPDLARVRDRTALARLTQAEQQDWRDLWAEVEALRKKASAPK
jgi:serine/threonine-protein kinase